NKVVDDEPTVVRDFNRRAPFWSYRTAAYRRYLPFANYKVEIDAYLERLFSGELDDGNGDVLDTLISDVFRQAEHDLARQRTEHRDVIVSFGIRATSDKLAFTRELEKVREALERNRQEQESIRTRLRTNEFVEV
ncbi:MAG: hypothetical protein K6G54_06875, partial [Oscillospiraceae bacterium]|nr:hypothetical protein [Oscillospiraceae bacterium]